MNAATQQIITAYEEAQMQPQEIASEFGWEEEAVKTILLQYSKVYYGLIKGQANNQPEAQSPAEEQLFTKQDQDIAARAMTELLSEAESEDTRYRVAKFIINERKGRHDVKVLKEAKVNINQFNIQIQRAKEIVKKALNTSQTPPAGAGNSHPTINLGTEVGSAA